MTGGICAPTPAAPATATATGATGGADSNYRVAGGGARCRESDVVLREYNRGGVMSFIRGAQHDTVR